VLVHLCSGLRETAANAPYLRKSTTQRVGGWFYVWSAI
jgi:hypothetical protein